VWVSARRFWIARPQIARRQDMKSNVAVRP
jgi:hypothetical protein